MMALKPLKKIIFFALMVLSCSVEAGWCPPPPPPPPLPPAPQVSQVEVSTTAVAVKSAAGVVLHAHGQKYVVTKQGVTIRNSHGTSVKIPQSVVDEVLKGK